MLSDANDVLRQLKKLPIPQKIGTEVSPNPKDVKPKKETPKNTETETYDYSDDENADDKEW